MSRGQDIRAGGAFVEMYVKGLGKAGRQIAQFGQRLTMIGAGITAVGAAVTGPLVAASRAFATAGDRLDKMADRTGFSVEALSELSFAADQSGASLAAVEKAAIKLQQQLGRAESGKGLGAQLEQLGLNVKELQAASPEEQFTKVAKAIGLVENPARRMTLALQAFGKAGAELLPLIISDFEKAREKARDLGLVMSTEDATAAAKLGDAMDALNKVQKRAWELIGAAVAGPLTKLYDAATNIIVTINKWVDTNREFFRTLLAVGAGISALGIGVTVLGGGLMLVGTLAMSTMGILSALGAALAFALSPLGLLTAGLAAGAIYFVRFNETGQQMLSQVGRAFGDMASKVQTSMQAIAVAIAGGDIQAAWEVISTHALMLFDDLFGDIAEGFKRFTETSMNALDIFQGQTAVVVASAIESWSTLWNALPDMASGAFDLIRGFMASWLADMADGINSLITQFSKWKGLDHSVESAFLKGMSDNLREQSQGHLGGADSALGEVERRFTESQKRLAQIKEQIEADTERKTDKRLEGRFKRESDRQAWLAGQQEKLGRSIRAIAEKDASGAYNGGGGSALSAAITAMGTFSGRELRGMGGQAENHQKRAADAAEEMVAKMDRNNFLLEEAATLA